jgi:hypothetical protein
MGGMSMNRLLKGALICGIIPLIVGMFIFVCWVITQWVWLTYAGIVWLFIGTAAVLVGIGLLVVYICVAVRAGHVRGRRLASQAAGIIGLYLANFAIASIVVVGVMTVMNLAARYTVTIINETHTVLDEARLRGPFIHVEYGSIAPGSEVSRTFLIQQDGSLVLTGKLGDKQLEETVVHYVTSGVVGRDRVTIKPGGEVQVDAVKDD